MEWSIFRSGQILKPAVFLIIHAVNHESDIRADLEEKRGEAGNELAVTLRG